MYWWKGTIGGLSQRLFCLFCFCFLCLPALFHFWLAIERLLDHIEHPAHEDGTEEILEGDEGVGDAEEEGGELEVDEEDDDGKVDEGVRRRDQVGLLVHNKDEGCQHAGLGRTGGERIGFNCFSLIIATSSR